MYWSEVPVHPTKQVYSVVVDYLAMPSVSWMRSAWWELTWTNSQHGRGEQMSLLMAGPSATTGLQVLASLPANGMSQQLQQPWRLLHTWPWQLLLNEQLLLQ
jgi:hypothetical protein